MIWFERFGETDIFRPSSSVEHAIRQRAIEHLFARFSPGEYRGAAAANAVIQHQFTFYERLIKPVLPRLAVLDAVDFLLFQYDQANRILHGRDLLDLRERERWMWIEPIFKRAIKYLIELICIESAKSNRPRPRVSRTDALFSMETAVICAENMVNLAQNSERVHSVTPDEALVRIFFGDRSLDYEITAEGTSSGFDRIFWERIRRDREYRDKVVGFPQFDNHTATHQEYLDDAFSSSFGMPYGDFIWAIRALIEGSRPSLAPNGFPTLFIHREQAVSELARSGRPRKALERAIDGFSVSPTNLEAERRVVWNPKQEARAYRRGFFLFPHELGPHLAFSKAMAQEALIQLVNWVSYRWLPVEWRTPLTQRALVDLSRAGGEWFENVVCQNLRASGITGQRRHRTIGTGEKSIRIPDAVGEIDFLGYEPREKLIILVESKMTMTGLEARYWRDDIHEFVFGSNSYATKFRKKLAWVRHHAGVISNALGVPADARVAAAMLTLYPCIAGQFIKDFPCVSIAEFRLDFERKGKWPYDTL
jgi:hypothetical protein